jgi:hypothetical protein
MSRRQLKFNDARVDWSVTDGRVGVGTVELRKGLFAAIDLSGHVVGRFATLAEAASVLQTLPQAEKE